MTEMKNISEKLEKRPPIVVVVGHVDHGKTSLLDYIKKTNVVAKEAGGITQSIGAYEVIHPSTSSGQASKITFIDTPGHEAFSKMRVRGARIADIGILVIAGDESVQPQTKEAIKALEESKTQYIVAVTKSDKQGFNLDKVKNDLAANNVLLESYGGSISYQSVSAKTGEGVNELLDLILLTAEMEDLKYDKLAVGKGVILESKMDKQRGLTVTVILEEGSLKVGEQIATASTRGKVKVLENFLGKREKELFPSSPAVVMGFESAPQIGEEFLSGKLGDKENEYLKKLAVAKKVASDKTKKDGVIINLILKADVAGSLEALCESMKNIKLKENQSIEIKGEGVGEISDGDVQNAISTSSIIIGFRVRENRAAANLAKEKKISIINSEIIYELVEAVESYLRGAEEKEVAGDFEILAVFGKKAGKQIIGGQVIKGVMKNNSWIEIQKGNDIIGKGKIINLQQDKRDAVTVTEGKECGILLNSDTQLEVGYHFILR